MTVRYIELNKLVKSPLNVRRTTSKAACEELKASILAHGLMQNLVVVPGGKGDFEVIAGARRLAALKSLAEEGNLPADHAVQCQVVDEDQAAEMSLAENTVRAAMHPADEFEAFAALIDSSATVEQISQRFGKTARYVEQRLKLGRAAPELIQDYREGKLKLETLEAYTITDDRKRQLKVRKAMEGSWDKNSPAAIRRMLTEKLVEAGSRLASFVGLDTYEAAGGTLRSDLFGEDVYLENPELLHALVEEKLKLAKQELEAEGWQWVIVAAERDWKTAEGCTRLKPQAVAVPQDLLDRKSAVEAEMEVIQQEWDAADADDDELLDAIRDKESDAQERLEEIDDQIASHVVFTDDQMQRAGCYAYVGHGGRLEVEKGLVKPSDAKKVAAAQGVDSGDDEDDDDQPAAKPKGMSDSLRRDLEAYRLAAAQAEIAKHPAIAFDLLVFKAAKSLGGLGHAYDGPNVSFNRNSGGCAAKEACGFVREQMDAIEEKLHLDWREMDSEFDQFHAFQKLSADQKHAILAFCVAATLQPKLAPDAEDVADGAVTAYDIALSQTGANVADYWRPTKNNYLSRITKDQLLEIGRDLIGGERGDHWAKANAKEKKGDIAEELHRNFAARDAAPSPRATPEQVERLRNWLPKGMEIPRIEPAAEPKQPKAGKSRKAA